MPTLRPRLDTTTGSNALHPLTLQFLEPALEAAYQSDGLALRRRRARWVYLLLASLFVALILSDSASGTGRGALPHWSDLVAMGLFLGLLASSQLPWLQHRFDGAAFIALNLCTLLITARLLSTGAGLSHIHYLGYLLVVAAAFGFSGNSIVQGFISLGLVMVSFNGAMLHLDRLPSDLLASYDFFLVAVAVIAAATGYLLEKQQRVLFYQVVTFHEDKPDGIELEPRLAHRPNRDELEVRIELALDAASRDARKLAIVYLELANFRPLRGRHGRQVGDLVLKIVAERLQRGVRGSDTVAHYRDDGFLMILEDLKSEDDVRQVLGSVRKRMAKPIHLEVNHEVRSFLLPASAGVAVYPDNGSDPAELIDFAERAIYLDQADPGGSAMAG